MNTGVGESADVVFESAISATGGEAVTLAEREKPQADSVVPRRWEKKVSKRFPMSHIPPGMSLGSLPLPDEGSVVMSFKDDTSLRIIHRVGFNARPGRIIPPRMAEGNVYISLPSGSTFTPHLTYSFQFDPCSVVGRTYAGAYQGVGLSLNSFTEVDYLGSPCSFYIFQGARIARLWSRGAFNYEWNFGISTPWNPYSDDKNPENRIIGSKVNAYLNFNFYINWMVSSHIDLNAGIDLTHFSNGNTSFPNAGLNTVGLKLGLVCNFNRESADLPKKTQRRYGHSYPHHVSYDIIVFGSWRRRGITEGNETMLLADPYTVLGFSFVPMYNFGENLRAGVGLDGFYDSSANLNWDGRVRYDSNGAGVPLHKQLALGLSGRVDFVMPYFTIGLGVGTNVLHGGGDMKSVYQILSLKIELIRSAFLHIGYSLHNFHDPNFLMLGIGCRLNDKSPAPYRKRRH